MRIVRVKQMLADRMASITIAAEFDPTKVDTVRVGIAFQSPQDNFCRKIGRDIAIGRMVHDPRFVLDAKNVCKDGQIRAEELLRYSFGLLDKWDRKAILVSDPFEREDTFKRPRWFGQFLDMWKSELRNTT